MDTAVERFLERGVHRDPRRKLVDLNVGRDRLRGDGSGANPCREAVPDRFVARECPYAKARTGEHQCP